MKALEDLTKLVNLQQVASESVKPETPHRECRVVFDVENVRGISQAVHQIFLSQLTAQLVKAR